MCGAAAVLSAFDSIAELGPKCDVLAVVALAENAIDATALKPLEIVKSAKGLSVEVSNTDAEGRLCLADAMTYAQKMHPYSSSEGGGGGGAGGGGDREKLAAMVEMSTLTGACVVALGEEAAGLFTNDSALETELRDAGSACGETLWPMPGGSFSHPVSTQRNATQPCPALSTSSQPCPTLFYLPQPYPTLCNPMQSYATLCNPPPPSPPVLPNHEKEISGEGSHADLKSCGPTRWGGACTAAAFLKQFVEDDTPWAHVDIAGPSMADKAKGGWPAGATGFGADTLVRWIEGKYGFAERK